MLLAGGIVVSASPSSLHLDSARSEEISQFVQQLNQRDGLTVILITHNPELAKTAHRIVELRDGALLPAENFKYFSLDTQLQKDLDATSIICYDLIQKHLSGAAVSRFNAVSM